MWTIYDLGEIVSLVGYVCILTMTFEPFLGPSPQGMGNMGGMGGMAGMGMQGLGFGFQNPMAGRLGLPGMQAQQAGSSVILVSNLDEQVWSTSLSFPNITG